MADSLAYFSGSPFARMARVLIREWALPVEEVELAFPPTRDLFARNPLGQVPLLTLGERSYFPTLIVVERLWDLAGRPPEAYEPDAERQLLLTILQTGDALASAAYQGWAGLEPIGKNSLGFDPADRNRARADSALVWLAGLYREGGLRPGLTLPAIALACILLWTDARDPIDWRRHPELEALVDPLAARESFMGTAPRAWKPA